MNKSFCTVFTLFLALALGAQQPIQQLKRLEFSRKDGYIDADTHPMGSLGAMQVFRLEQDRRIMAEFDFFDTNLQLMDSKSFPLPKKFYEQYVVNDSTHYLGLWKNDNSSDYYFFYSNFASLKVDYFRGRLAKKESVEALSYTSKYILLLGRKKKEWRLTAFDPQKRQTSYYRIKNMIPALKNSGIISVGFQNIPKPNTLLMHIISYNKNERKYRSYFVELTDQLHVRSVVMLNAPRELTLHGISATTLPQGAYLLTGTYSTNNVERSEGIFIARIAGGKSTLLHTYRFTDFDNFFNYLPPKKQEKIKRKSQRKKAKGKSLDYAYNISCHNIISLNDSYLFVGEAYFPTYTTYPLTSTSYINGHPVTKTYYQTLFDGYRYTHAVVVAFNKQGDKLWDYTMPMSILNKPYSVRNFIRVVPGNGEIIKLIESTGPGFHAEIIDREGHVIKSNIRSTINTGLEGDKVTYYYSDVAYWYGNYYLSFGEQTIKNKQLTEEERKRKVWFVTKVRYGNE